MRSFATMIAKSTDAKPYSRADDASADDAVVWRWPGKPWEWLRAGWIWGRVSVATVATALGAAVGAGIITNALLVLREKAGNVAAAPVDATFVLAPAFFLYAVGCLFVPRVAVTGRAICLGLHMPWRRPRILPRSEILAAMIYEGDGTVFLVSTDGNVLRVPHVGKVAAFADALTAPTLAWPVRKLGKVLESLVLAEMVCFLVLTFICCAAALVVVNIVAPSSFGYLPRVFVSLFTGPVLGIFLATTPVLAIGRRFVSQKTLDEFIARNLDLARWLGREPTVWGWANAFFAARTRFAMRVLDIAPPPPLQPELRHGATPELAASLAAREGSAS